MWETVTGRDKSAVFWRDGIVYQHWQHKGLRETPVDQIILSQNSVKKVLEIAHRIFIAGHLGKRKTTARILRRLYWSNLHQDVADYFRSCATSGSSVTHEFLWYNFMSSQSHFTEWQ